MNTFHHADGTKTTYEVIDHYLLSSPDGEHQIVGYPLPHLGVSVIRTLTGIFGEAEWIRWGWKVEKIMKSAPVVGNPNPVNHDKKVALT